MKKIGDPLRNDFGSPGTISQKTGLKISSKAKYKTLKVGRAKYRNFKNQQKHAKFRH